MRLLSRLVGPPAVSDSPPPAASRGNRENPAPHPVHFSLRLNEGRCEAGCGGWPETGAQRSGICVQWGSAGDRQKNPKAWGSRSEAFQIFESDLENKALTEFDLENKGLMEIDLENKRFTSQKSHSSAVDCWLSNVKSRKQMSYFVRFRKQRSCCASR
jgi:hypothetical protein